MRSLAVFGLTISLIFTFAPQDVSADLLIRFDGTLSGTTYTLGAGEIDSTGTFAGFGAPVVSGGMADLDGGGTHEGFNFDPTSFGDLTTLNWVVETTLNFDTFGGGQLTAIDVQGDTDFRINNSGTLLEAGYWDGSSFGNQTTALPAADASVHLALVWDATATSLTGYVDGVSIGVIDNNAFAQPDANNISFGYFGRNGFDNRGIDGQLDAVAFKTFAGSFDPNSDFQLLNAIPEPSSVALLAIAGIGFLRRRQKRN